MTDRILILDFGSQVTQLIARRVRENGVYCEIQPVHGDRRQDPRLRPARRHPVGRPGLGDACRRRRARPTSCSGSACRCSAICYGMQTMCAQLGGRVTLSDHQEFGRAFIDIIGECRLFEGLWPKGAREQVWMSHGDKVDALPPGFRAVAVERRRPLCRDRRRRAPVLRRPVPPRGRAHAAGRPAACATSPTSVCGCPRRLDDGGVPRPGDRAHPRPGRAAAG